MHVHRRTKVIKSFSASLVSRYIEMCCKLSHIFASEVLLVVSFIRNTGHCCFTRTYSNTGDTAIKMQAPCSIMHTLSQYPFRNEVLQFLSSHMHPDLGLTQIII